MWIIDRLEPPFAMCENSDTGERKNIPLAELPADIREGDVLRETSSGYQVDEDETHRRRERIAGKMRNLFHS